MNVVVADDVVALHEALGLVDGVAIEADAVERDVLEVVAMVRRVSPGLPLVLLGVAAIDLAAGVASGSAPVLVVPPTVPLAEACGAVRALYAS